MEENRDDDGLDTGYAPPEAEEIPESGAESESESEPLPDDSEPEPVIEPRPSFAERAGGFTAKAGDVGASAFERAGEFVNPEPNAPPNNDMSDLFEVPQENDNDMYIDDLFEVDDADIMGDDDPDMSDLTRVTQEDIMGPTPRKRRVIRNPRRPTRSPDPMSDSMGGMRY